MVTYPAVVEWDDNADAYGVVFPDLSIGAMGDTLEEALVNAKSMLGDYVLEMDKEGWFYPSPSTPESIEVPQGQTLVTIPLVLPAHSDTVQQIASGD